MGALEGAWILCKDKHEVQLFEVSRLILYSYDRILTQKGGCQRRDWETILPPHGLLRMEALTRDKYKRLFSHNKDFLTTQIHPIRPV